VENGVLDFTSDMRGWLFCLAFASIGLSANFRELRAQFHGGKPLILYVCGQTLNLCLTLLMAWIMFYKVFPEITNSL
jgi:Na+/glutamate symporter